MVSFRPITSRIRSRWLSRVWPGPDPEIIELAPSAEWPLEPVIILPDEIDRIIADQGNSDPAANRALLAESILRQGPTRAFCWRDAIVADGSVMSASNLHVLGEHRTRKPFVSGLTPIAQAVLCSSFQTEHFFGHWLVDGLPHELLAPELGAPPIALEGPPWPQKAQYRELVRMEADRADDMRVERLWMLDDSQLNRSRVERIEKLRGRLSSAVSGTNAKPVFVSRGSTGRGRVLANEPEVRLALEKAGFVTLEPERATAAEVAATLAAAPLVVSVEGSAIAHAIIAMPRGAGLLVIQPPSEFNMVWRSYCGVLGMAFGFTVADAGPNATFTMPPDRLLRAVDLMQAEIARRG